MCLLFQTFGRAYKLINAIVSSFVHTLRAATYATTHIYTDFSGLVENTPERKLGSAVHGQLGSALEPNLREVTLAFECRLLKAIACERTSLDSSCERLSRVLLSRVTPP